MAILLFTDLGLYLGAKLISINDGPSMFSITFGLFPSGGEKKIVPHLAFCTNRLGVLQGMYVCRNFRAKNRRSDLPMFNQH